VQTTRRAIGVGHVVFELAVGARRADDGALIFEAWRALAARRVAGDDKRAAGRARRQLAGAVQAFVAWLTHAVRGVCAGSLQRGLQLRTQRAWQAVEVVFNLRLVRAQPARCAHAKMAVVARPAWAVHDVCQARFVRQRPCRARRAGLRRPVVVVVRGARLNVGAGDSHLVARWRAADACALRVCVLSA